MAGIAFEDVSKVYPDGTRAVDRVNLEIEDGCLLVLVGPSGCGKTTLLRMIAGLEEVTGGSIRIDGRVINRVPPKERDIAMVFQNYALYPHMTVEENIGFGLRLRRMPKRNVSERVESTAARLGLEHLLARKPRQLSGGQRQRVAMARAIVREPKAFLMDEPLSNLDAKLRVQVRGEIAQLQHELRTTTVYVTHDQIEAMTLGDVVAVMRAGIIEQVSAPNDIYRHPANVFVAGFIGSPPMNMLYGSIVVADGSGTLRIADRTLPLPAETLAQHPRLREYENRPVIVGLRPEHLHEASARTNGNSDAWVEAEVQFSEPMGAETFIHCLVDATPVVTDDLADIAADTDAALLDRLSQAKSEQRTQLVARLDGDATLRDGERVRLAFDSSKLHFFDPASGESIGR
jgi:multiple sugar transport system ATP-binding protein